MYQQVLDPVGDSLAASALVAMIPLATLFVLLGGLKLKAHVAGLAALVVAHADRDPRSTACPSDTTFAVATEGAAFGLFPIIWIIWNAIWIYNMTVETGHFAVLRRSFAIDLRRPADPGRSSSRSASARCWRRWPGSARRWRSRR